MALESLEFKEEDSDAGAFRRRLAFAFGMVILCFSVLVMRLAWLQIIKQDTYQQRAEQNRTVTTTNQGSRGLIFDRNGTLIAGNRLSWSIEITQDQTVEPVNRLIDRLAEVIKITPADRRRFRRLREDLNRYDGIPIRTDLTDAEVAAFTAQRWRFPGVDINTAFIRKMLSAATLLAMSAHSRRTIRSASTPKAFLPSIRANAKSAR